MSPATYGDGYLDSGNPAGGAAPKEPSPSGRRTATPGTVAGSPPATSVARRPAKFSSDSPVIARSNPLCPRRNGLSAETSGPPTTMRVRGESRFTSRARWRLRSVFQGWGESPSRPGSPRAQSAARSVSPSASVAAGGTTSTSTPRSPAARAATARHPAASGTLPVAAKAAGGGTGSWTSRTRTGAHHRRNRIAARVTSLCARLARRVLPGNPGGRHERHSREPVPRHRDLLLDDLVGLHHLPHRLAVRIRESRCETETESAQPGVARVGAQVGAVDLVDPLRHTLGQRPLASVDTGIQLRDIGRAEEHRIDSWPRGDEAVGEIDGCDRRLLRERRVRFDELEEAPAQIALLVHRVLVEPRSRFRVLAQPLPGEEPTGERVVDRGVDRMLAGEGEVFDVELAHEHVVDDLRYRGPRHSRPIAQALDLDDLPGGEVRDAPIRDLPGAQEVVHRADRLVDRHFEIWLVQVVQVDLLDAEPREALVAGVANASGSEAFRGALADPRPHLGGDASFLASSAQRPAQDLLGLAVVVGVGSVENGNAPVEGAVDDATCLFFWRPLAEVHGADDNRRLRRRAGAQPGFHRACLPRRQRGIC